MDYSNRLNVGKLKFKHKLYVFMKKVIISIYKNELLQFIRAKCFS